MPCPHPAPAASRLRTRAGPRGRDAGTSSPGGSGGALSAADSPELRKNPTLYEALKEQTGAPAPKAGSVTKNNSSSGGGSSPSPGLTGTLGSGLAGAVPASAPAAAAAGTVLPRHKPEVLAPVGGWPQLHAAVENGADAVYFGLSDFNARAR